MYLFHYPIQWEQENKKQREKELEETILLLFLKNPTTFFFFFTYLKLSKCNYVIDYYSS